MPQELSHRLSQCLKHSQPQPPHHPLAATHARPSTRNCFRTAAAPLVILFLKPFFFLYVLSLPFIFRSSLFFSRCLSSSPSPSLQSAQYSSEAVSWLPGRSGGPVSVGEWRASSADHKPGAQFLLRPVSIQTVTSQLRLEASRSLKDPTCRVCYPCQAV